MSRSLLRKKQPYPKSQIESTVNGKLDTVNTPRVREDGLDTDSLSKGKPKIAQTRARLKTGTTEVSVLLHSLF